MKTKGAKTLVSVKVSEIMRLNPNASILVHKGMAKSLGLNFSNVPTDTKSIKNLTEAIKSPVQFTFI